MEKLTLKEMENIEGGSCFGAGLGLGIALLAASGIGSPVAAGIWAAGFIVGSINFAGACE